MKSFLKDFEKWFFRFSSIWVILILLCIIKVNYYLYLPGNLTNVKEEITIANIEDNLNGSVSSVYVLSFNKPSLFSYLVGNKLKYGSTVKYNPETVVIDNKLDTAIGLYDSKTSFSNAELASYSLYKKEDGEFKYHQICSIYSASSDVVSNKKYTQIVGSAVKRIPNLDKDYPSITEVSAYLQTIEIGKDALFTVEKNGAESNLTVKKRDVDGQGLFGLTFTTQFIIDEVTNVSVGNVFTIGPSGGAMQSLYIYLLLNQDTDYLKGRNVAGTGTIGYEIQGSNVCFTKVGAIGCVEQKLWAAYIDHASVFFCPSGNINDCMKAYEKYGFDESDIKVVEVSYLEDIINYLKETN